ncbi:MAG: NUDIX domain-containing protein [Microbacteriaceae bacterium]
MTAPGGVPVIRVVAALAVDDAGRLLLVRKRGTTAFMQPGGKPEPGEGAAEALVRELHEELGVVVAESSLTHLGRFEAPAANEPGHGVDAEVFALELPGSVAPHAEIEELRWLHPAQLHLVEVAPLVTMHMMRLIDGGGIGPSR